MQERTRYRVTGTLFLLALGVIFLPMLFDGEGEPALELPAIEPVESPAVDIVPFDQVVPQSDVVERVRELKDEVDEEGFATDTGTRFGEPVLQTVTPDDEVFAVQAASFGQLENARRFREELRGAGYEAFISTARVDAESLVHRVAVGPLLSRDDAATIRADVARRFSVEARIMAMTQ